MNIEIKSDGTVGGTELLLDSKRIHGIQNFRFSGGIDGDFRLDMSLVLLTASQVEEIDKFNEQKEYYLPKNFVRNTMTGTIDNTEIF